MIFKYRILYVLIIGAVILMGSCMDSGKKKDLTANLEVEKTEVEVVTNGMDFQMPKMLKSGWTTFKYINKSLEPHFFILEKMPDTLGLTTYKEELFPPFISAIELFQQGKIEAGMKEFENIPDWYYKVELGGGVGLTSQKTTARSTIFLEPGTYVMECYVRMPNGMPHVFLGMVKELTVTEDSNGRVAPKAVYSIGISSENGISFVDSLKAGSHTLAVEFEDQMKYEHFLGHDVNLVRIANDSLVPVLSNWLNTLDFNAFRSPAPKGLLFLGGVEDLPGGKTGYFEVDLDKGQYVLISEIPNAMERNMFKVFRVF